MSSSQFVIKALSDKHWLVVFDHPPSNIINPETVLEFQALVDKIEASETVQVVVFESANPDYFFGRYDLARAGDTPTTPGPTGFPTWIDMTVRLSQLPVVSIAKIRGRTRGGGAELAEAMDMRFASREKAIFGQPEVGAGIVPGGGALDRLPPLLGRARALEVILASLDYDAATAELYGWVNRALPDAELDAHVDLIASRIASFDKSALAAAKNFVNRHTLPAPEDLLAVQNLFLGPAATWPTVPERRAKIYAKVVSVGAAEFELNMGKHLGEV